MRIWIRRCRDNRGEPIAPSFKDIFLLTSWKNRTLFGWSEPGGPGEQLEWWALTMGLLGLGTALVYPTLLAAVADVAHPDWRASAVGVYRLWRDSGYASGALLAGVLADLFGISLAIGVIGGVTFLSGIIAHWVIRETLPSHQKSPRSTLHNSR